MKEIDYFNVIKRLKIKKKANQFKNVNKCDFYPTKLDMLRGEII